MKQFYSIIALMAVFPLSGCGGQSSTGSGNAATINCAVEIQLAVVSGRKPGHALNDGDWRIAAAWVLPVRSTGGPGHVICNSDGALIEFQWNDVQLTNNGTVIGFGDCKWAIQNRIDRRDGVSQNIGGHLTNNKTVFETDFLPLASCELDTMLNDTESREQSDRRLVIRGRLLPQAPPTQPLNLAELTQSPG